MFDDIGSKIKSLAKALCCIGIIASVIVAIVMFVMVEEGPYSMEGFYMGMGWAFLIVGPLLSWIGSFFTYGFGELIEKAAEIAKNTKKTEVENNNFLND